MVPCPWVSFGQQQWKVFCAVLGHHVIVASHWMSFFPCVIPSGGTLEKEEERCSSEQRSVASYVLFLSCGHCTAQGLDEVFDVCV